MLNKILSYSVVGVLALTLLGGTVYVLARPSEAGTERGWSQEDSPTTARGYGQNREAVEAEAPLGQQRIASSETGGYRGGQGVEGGRGQNATDGQGQGAGTGRGQGAADGRGQGEGVGNSGETAESHDWATIQGMVTEAGNELTVQTSDGEIVVGMGQSAYRDQSNFSVAVGDEVRIEGFYEDGEFKAGTVENLSTEQVLVLRDATGRPMWAGRGNLQNRP